MELNELIVIEQLPVIKQQFEVVKFEIEEAVNSALALECNENTVSEIRAVLANLRKDKKDYDDKLREVKSKLMSPYEAFRAAYDECITDVYNAAFKTLNNRIKFVDDKEKQRKRIEAKAYFDECVQAAEIDFLNFEDAKINITKSASLKSIKETAKKFVDRVSSDLKLISMQGYKEEILVEYKKDLNASRAITDVIERHKAIDKEIETSQKKTVVTEYKTTPKVHKPLSAPVVHDEKMYRASFTVEATLEHLKGLKAYITDKGIKIVK